MRLLLDQLFHLDLAVVLRGEGHDVVHLSELGQSQADDDEVLMLAQRDARVLVTRDGDFGDWTVLPLREHNGVIRVETRPTTTLKRRPCWSPFWLRHSRRISEILS